MMVKECYMLMEADYDDVVHRLNNDDRIKRFLKMTLQDENFSKLCIAMEHKDYEAAFIAAHTLKGIALNMSLTKLAQVDAKLTELLRQGTDIVNIDKVFEEVKVQYEQMQKAVSQLLCQG